jgi:hypothetical protein
MRHTPFIDFLMKVGLTILCLMAVGAALAGPLLLFFTILFPDAHE